MVRRIVNIASVLCLVACVALVALWVRSYRTADRLHGRFWGRQSFIVGAKDGRLVVAAFRWQRNSGHQSKKSPDPV